MHVLRRKRKRGGPGCRSFMVVVVVVVVAATAVAVVGWQCRRERWPSLSSASSARLCGGYGLVSFIASAPVT